MNTYSLIAGIISLLAAAGHFTYGKKWYYNPLKKSNLDELVKSTFYCLFHYTSVFLTLSTFILIMIGFRGSGCIFEPLLVLGFIGGNYFLFGVVNLVSAILSPVKGASLKMFQWIIWFLISVFTFLALSSAWVYVNEWK